MLAIGLLLATAGCDLRPVDVGLWPPEVGLNGLHESCSTNLLGLGLPRTRAGELRGIQLALGSAEVEGKAKGIQIGGLATVAGDGGFGLQLAGLATVDGDSFRGVSVAGLSTVTGGGARGVQVAGLSAVAGDGAEGIFVSGLASVAGESATGLFASGLVSVAGGEARGLFVSGLVSVAGDSGRGLFVSGLGNVAGENFTGLQVGGLGNVSGGETRGVQLGGLGNFSSDLYGVQVGGLGNQIVDGRGLQLASLYNRARGDLKGAQIALVNVASGSASAQIGLVNIARAARFQLGLVNLGADAAVGAYSGKPQALELWTSEAVPVQAALRTGGRRTYSLITGGANPGRTLAAGLGSGVRLLSRGSFALETDALAQFLSFRDARGGSALLAAARLRATYQLYDHFGLFAGAALNLFVSGDRDGSELTPGPSARTGHTRAWPGVLAGISL